MSKKVYIIENLDCANCAAKIEAKFNAHEKVQEAIITFSTKQLRLTAEDPDALIPELTKIARTVEGEVVIRPRNSAHQQEEHHHHEHGDGCCGHDHEVHDHECGCGHKHHHDHECGYGGDHHHDHACGCGHDHHHDHECGCGGDHHHDHACGCGHKHHHDHECGCGHDHHHEEHDHDGPHHAPSQEQEHDHDHGHAQEESARPLLIGAGLFVLGLVLNSLGLKWLNILCCLTAYVILGKDVVMTAVKNLTKGHVFDENFLISLATVGALFIGEYP